MTGWQIVPIGKIPLAGMAVKVGAAAGSWFSLSTWRIAGGVLSGFTRGVIRL